MASLVVRTAAQFAVLMGFWLALSGRWEPAYIAMGAVAVGLVLLRGGDLLRSRHAAGEARPTHLREAFVNWLRFVPYLGWLIIEIFRANIQVAYLILHPRMPIDPVLVRFRTELPSDVAEVLLAHSITLTPGTVTIDVQDGDYLVHALNTPTAEELIEGGMQDRVGRVFGVRPSRNLSGSMTRRMQGGPK
jgi:multicomponent Na+:H+ antiporter subunit E